MKVRSCWKSELQQLVVVILSSGFVYSNREAQCFLGEEDLHLQHSYSLCCCTSCASQARFEKHSPLSSYKTQNLHPPSALERTFLAYIRTSNALASLSIAIYQLSRLSSPSKSSQPSSPTVLTFEKVITILMICCALLLTIVGCGRFLMLQKKVEHGRWRIGGGEIWGVGWGFVMVSYLDC